MFVLHYQIIAEQEQLFHSIIMIRNTAFRAGWWIAAPTTVVAFSNSFQTLDLSPDGNVADGSGRGGGGGSNIPLRSEDGTHDLHTEDIHTPAAVVKVIPEHEDVEDRGSPRTSVENPPSTSSSSKATFGHEEGLQHRPPRGRSSSASAAPKHSTSTLHDEPRPSTTSSSHLRREKSTTASSLLESREVSPSGAISGDDQSLLLQVRDALIDRQSMEDTLADTKDWKIMKLLLRDQGRRMVGGFFVGGGW